MCSGACTPKTSIPNHLQGGRVASELFDHTKALLTSKHSCNPAAEATQGKHRVMTRANAQGRRKTSCLSQFVPTTSQLDARENN
jgi:hypothetical protein